MYCGSEGTTDLGDDEIVNTKGWLRCPVCDDLGGRQGVTILIATTMKTVKEREEMWGCIIG